MREEKPKYGWYVKGLIVGFLITGLIGLSIFLFGFIFEGFLRIMLLTVGGSIIFLFLWPAIGMAVLNLTLSDNDSIKKWMKSLNKIESPQILDIGCGTGRTAIKIAKEMDDKGHLYGIDIYIKLAISGNALETVQKNARIEKVEHNTTFQYGSATEIPFENEKFDIVNVSSVLHEIHDIKGQQKVIQEIHRVLRPDSYLYLGEWNRTAWQLILYMGVFCFVFKRKNYWKQLLMNNGFKEIQLINNQGYIVFEATK